MGIEGKVGADASVNANVAVTSSANLSGIDQMLMAMMGLGKGTTKIKKQMKDMGANSEHASKAFGTLRNSMNLQGITTLKANMGIKRFKEDMGNLGIGVNNTGKFFDIQRNKVLKHADVLNKVRRYSLVPFRGELLSMMFISMGVNKAISGLTQPALQAAGAFDYWRAVMIDLFMPFIESFIIPGIEKLDDLIGIMPEGLKTWVGGIIMVIGFLAGLTAMVAMVDLLLANYNLSVGAAAIKTYAWATSVDVLGISLGALFAIVMLAALAIALLVVHWDDFKAGLKALGEIERPIDFLKDMIKYGNELGNVLQNILAFLSPIAELFGAKPYQGNLGKTYAPMPSRASFPGVVAPSNYWASGGYPDIGDIRGPGGDFAQNSEPLINGPYAPTININGTDIANMDYNEIARRVSESMDNELRRLGIE